MTSDENPNPSASRPVLVQFDGGRTLIEYWEKTRYCCANCGMRAVWSLDNGGDHYGGEYHMCSGCGAHWEMACKPEILLDSDNGLRLAGLRQQERQTP